jgi:hypothetical protein
MALRTNSLNYTSMNHVICCWCDTDSNRFEKHVPVLFSGRRNIRLGYTNKINLLFLSGYELLTGKHNHTLRDTGYTLHDLNPLCREFEFRYSSLKRFGSYEMKCFLRWLVMSSYLRGEPIFHYDIMTGTQYLMKIPPSLGSC